MFLIISSLNFRNFNAGAQNSTKHAEESQVYTSLLSRKKITKGFNGGIINEATLKSLCYRRDFLFPFSLLLLNTRPVGRQVPVTLWYVSYKGIFPFHFLFCFPTPRLLADWWLLSLWYVVYVYVHPFNVCLLLFQDSVQLLITVMLLADLFVTLLMLFLFYWIALGAFLAVLLILPLSLLSPFPAGLNALFTNGPRRASLARVYALWNASSISNIVSKLLYVLLWIFFTCI